MSKEPLSIVVTDLLLEPIYVSDYYDGPMSGLCVVDGHWWAFHRSINDDTVTLTQLTWRERLCWWRKKTTFEIMVGRHCTYRNGVSGRTRDWSKGIAKLLFRMYFYWRWARVKSWLGIRISNTVHELKEVSLSCYVYTEIRSLVAYLRKKP